MAVCSFLGTGNVYESNLYSRLLATLECVVAENETVELLFLYRSCKLSEFSDLCLQAAEEMREKYPKKVTIIFAQNNVSYKDKKWIGCWGQPQTPDCIPDKTITFDTLNVEIENSIARHKQFRRWMINLSTHVVSYVYEKFFDSERYYFRIARRCANLELIDLTSTAINQMIREGSLTLPDREQLIYRKLDEGCTYKEIAALLGLTSERVRQLETSIGHKLRKFVLSRNRPDQ